MRFLLLEYWQWLSSVQRGGFGKRPNMPSFHLPVMPRGVEVV